MRVIRVLDQIESKKAAVIFTDINGFTRLTEILAADVFRVLNHYFENCAAVVDQFGGQYFETISDGWILLVAGKDCEIRGFNLCVAWIKKIHELYRSEPWKNLISHPAWNELFTLTTRIGLHYGWTTIGSIGIPGFSRRCIIGEGAEIAAKLESLNRSFQTSLLFTDIIARQIPEIERHNVRQVDAVYLKNHDQIQPENRHDIFTYDFNIPPAYAQFRELYDHGFQYYLNGEWEQSINLFKQAQTLWMMEQKAGDPVIAVLLERIYIYLNSPPLKWNGAVPLTGKAKKYK